MTYWTAASDFDAFPAIAGYVDCNGNQFESYEDACRYYGADTPAQIEAEERYWAEEDAREQFLVEVNEALVFGPEISAMWLDIAERAAQADRAAGWATVTISYDDIDDECPF